MHRTPSRRTLARLLPLVALTLIAEPRGVRADTPSAPAAGAAPARPAQVDLTPWVPPVADQGKTGSGVGWAVAYYCYTAAMAKERALTPDQVKRPENEFSPSYLWHQFNGGSQTKGMQLNRAFELLHDQGCATMADMPWVETDLTTQPDADAKAKAARFEGVGVVDLAPRAAGPVDTEALKNWLATEQTPLVFGLRLYHDFFTASTDPDYVYTPSTDPDNEPQGGHALCIVGYDDARHAFRAVNSWGPGWGDHGYLWLSEKYVQSDVRQVWGLRPAAFPPAPAPAKPIPEELYTASAHPAAALSPAHIKAATAPLRARVLVRPPAPIVRVLHGLRGPITSIAFSFDSRKIVCLGRHGRVKVWDVDTGAALCSIHVRFAQEVDFFHTNNCVMVQYPGNENISLWNATTGKRTSLAQVMKGVNQELSREGLFSTVGDVTHPLKFYYSIPSFDGHTIALTNHKGEVMLRTWPHGDALVLGGVL